MCLTIETNQEPKVAIEAITCFKIYHKKDGELKSFYRQAKTVPGIQPKVEMTLRERTTFQLEEETFIEAGYHSFTDLKEVERFLNLFTRVELIKGTKSLALHQCVIPRGSLFHVGSFEPLWAFDRYESYASDQLIVEGEINLDRLVMQLNEKTVWTI